MHRNALEYKPDGLWAQVSENTSHGVMGMISALPKDEATLNALVEEINELNRLTEQKEQTDSSIHRTGPQSVWSIQKGTANHSGSFLNGIRCPGMQNSLSRSDCTRHMALPCPDNRIRMVQSFPGHRAKRKAYRLSMSRNSSAGFGPQDALPMPDCA